jgi:hypothetical protein
VTAFAAVCPQDVIYGHGFTFRDFLTFFEDIKELSLLLVQHLFQKDSVLTDYQLTDTLDPGRSIRLKLSAVKYVKNTKSYFSRGLLESNLIKLLHGRDSCISTFNHAKYEEQF